MPGQGLYCVFWKYSFLLTSVLVVLDQIPPDSCDVNKITLPQKSLYCFEFFITGLRIMAVWLRTMNIFSFITVVSASFVVSVLHFVIFCAVFHIFAGSFKEYFSQRMTSSLISPSQRKIPFFWHDLIKYYPMTRVSEFWKKKIKSGTGKLCQFLILWLALRSIYFFIFC